jgi:hypothetical protein
MRLLLRNRSIKPLSKAPIDLELRLWINDPAGDVIIMRPVVLTP